MKHDTEQFPDDRRLLEDDENIPFISNIPQGEVATDLEPPICSKTGSFPPSLVVPLPLQQSMKKVHGLKRGFSRRTLLYSGIPKLP
jgi:hypothetical protein